jgi:1-deoxy-D-xylulose-5-phosphate reductoisomerase
LGSRARLEPAFLSQPVKKRVILLGSTGSIGASALKVARALPERMEIAGLAAHSSVDAVAAQALETGARHVAMFNPVAAAELRTRLPAGTRIYTGAEGLIDLVEACEADLLLVAIVGTAGLAPALAGIRKGVTLAVASKEILVMAGEAVTGVAAAAGVPVLPVDSEHNAIFQCLQGSAGARDVRRLLLTASGGPFRELPAEKLPAVTVREALRHPTWDMGRKITIDSATLFNKGLEMIEARWLFDVPMERIEVVVHPQSIVHSMVEFEDRSVLAQLSRSDMCFPIQYAVTWPERVTGGLEPLDFAALGSLTFEAPRREDFPALDLAAAAGTTGGTLPAVLNAANEVAVAAFLEERCAFPDIWRTVERVMNAHQVIEHPGLDAVIDADQWARARAAEELG